MSESSSLKDTNSIAASMFTLSKKYMDESPKKQSGSQGLAQSHSDEEDRFHTFLNIVDEAFKNRFALEQGINIIQKNFENPEKGYPEYKPPELRYKVEKNKNDGLFRLVPVSKTTAKVTTILDFMDRSLEIKLLNKGDKLLVDTQDVIRFVRFHSKENQILNFKSDPLSQIAKEMYGIYLGILRSTKTLRKSFVQCINKTSLGELEQAFTNEDSDNFKELLRCFFQSTLPIINEDHYNKAAGKPAGTRRARTENISDQFKKEFLKKKNKLYNQSSNVLTFAYWLRKTLRYIIQQNHEKARSKSSAQTASKYFDVGISYTIGEEEHSLFYIEDDFIISPERSVQRADKKDKWVSVSKSEKLHRISKKDFFRVLQQFIQVHLNPSLEKYGFEPVSLTGQYIPEIKSRIENELRRNQVRSGILGTSMSSMEEFRSNKAFLQSYLKYFHNKEDNFKNFPKSEKMRLLTSEIAAYNTSILQMKYRKMLKTQNDITKEILKYSLANDKKVQKELKTLKQILDGIRKIMEIAKPGLKEVT